MTEEMAAARFNVFWYLSFFAPAAIMLLATFWKQKRAIIAGVVMSVIVTYTLCNLAVQEKWKTRWEMAKTEKELEAASVDGANLVFTTYVSGPLEAAMHTWFWGYFGRKAWPFAKKQQGRLE